MTARRVFDWHTCGEPDKHVWNVSDPADVTRHVAQHPDGEGFGNLPCPAPIWTVYDLPSDDPPAQLLEPFLTPEGPVVLYARGGTGKGLTAAHLALRLVREHDMRVMVVDYENHPHEWGRRLKRMGASDEERKAIEYGAPYGEEWGGPRGQISDEPVAEYLQTLFRERQLDYLLVDSYSTASKGGDAMGGVEGATTYFPAVNRITKPSLTIAHVASASGRFPDKPFGSVHVHNAARETWALEQNEEEEPTAYNPDRLAAIYQPKTIHLELHNMKMSESSKRPPQFIDVSFFADGEITVEPIAAPLKRSLYDKIVDVLARASEPMTTDSIVLAIRKETGEAIKTDTAYRTLSRTHGTRFAHTDDMPQKWTLRDPS